MYRLVGGLITFQLIDASSTHHVLSPLRFLALDILRRIEISF